MSGDAAVIAHASEAIRKGSNSFAAAARLFGRDTRGSAVMLYAWCRHCDDVIDGQSLGHDGAVRSGPALAELERLEQQTRLAFEPAVPADNAFAALQEVIRRHAIPQRYPLDHLDGFRMDVEERRYDTLEDLLQYCYRVAGVVGIMMAHVMGVRDPATLDRACDLGIAFQLTNIARDVIPDARSGRIYLPRDWLREAGVAPEEIALPRNRPAVAAVVARLLAASEGYYRSAGVGLSALPLRSAWAIATARAVYREIGVEVLRRGPRAWDSRVSTSKFRKLALTLRGGLEAAGASRRPASARQGLWRRPE